MKSSDSDRENVQSVKVMIRCRPALRSEQLNNDDCMHFSDNKIQIGNKKFAFDRVFDPSASQENVYSNCVSDLLDGCFQGYNATVLAYGQTGSGKTYTMGTSADLDQESMGIIPRVAKEIFNRIECSLTVSFLEIHNEEIKDLLSPLTKPVLRENATGDIVILNLTQVSVKNLEEMFSALHSGSLARTTGSTWMNTNSSRSHAIFTIQIHQKIITGVEAKSNANVYEYISSKFHLVDLAGSERAKKTGAVGARFKESVTINRGLLALGNVINSLCEDIKDARKTHVPYRESKLTRLLQDSLGGNSRTLMIACVSPLESNFEESLNTVKYASRARNIKNSVVKNVDKQLQHDLRLKQMQDEIFILQAELGKYKSDSSIEADIIENNSVDIDKGRNSNLKNSYESIRSTLSILCARINALFSLELDREQLKLAIVNLRSSFDHAFDTKNLEEASKLGEKIKLIQQDFAGCRKEIAVVKKDIEQIIQQCENADYSFRSESIRTSLDSLRKSLKSSQTNCASLEKELLRVSEEAVKWKSSPIKLSPRRENKKSTNIYEENDQVCFESSGISSPAVVKSLSDALDNSSNVLLSLEVALREKEDLESLLAEKIKENETIDVKLQQQLSDLTITIKLKERMVDDCVAKMESQNSIVNKINEKSAECCVILEQMQGLQSSGPNNTRNSHDKEHLLERLRFLEADLALLRKDRLNMQQVEQCSVNLEALEYEIKELKFSEMNLVKKSKSGRSMELQNEIMQLKRNLRVQQDRIALLRSQSLKESKNNSINLIESTGNMTPNSLFRTPFKKSKPQRSISPNVLLKKHDFIDHEVSKYLIQKESAMLLEKEIEDKSAIVSRKLGLMKEKDELLNTVKLSVNDDQRASTLNMLQASLLDLNKQIEKKQVEYLRTSQIGIKSDTQTASLIQLNRAIETLRIRKDELIEKRLKVLNLTPSETGLSLNELEDQVDSLNEQISFKDAKIAELANKVAAYQPSINNQVSISSSTLGIEKGPFIEKLAAICEPSNQEEITVMTQKYCELSVRVKEMEKLASNRIQYLEFQVEDAKNQLAASELTFQQAMIHSEARFLQMQETYKSNVEKLLKKVSDLENENSIDSRDNYGHQIDNLIKDNHLYKQYNRDLKKQLKELALREETLTRTNQQLIDKNAELIETNRRQGF